MKKEIGAGILLAVLFVASLINIRYLEDFCDSTVELIGASQQSAENGDWPAAVQLAEQAQTQWQRNRGYTHIFIRHTELDATTEAFYAYLTCLYGQTPEEVRGLGLALQARIQAVLDMERINFGTIF